MKLYILLFIAMIACWASAEEIVLEETNIQEFELGKRPSKGCTKVSCITECKRKGKSGGVCIQKQTCVCYRKFFDLKEEPLNKCKIDSTDLLSGGNEMLAPIAAACDNEPCMQDCIRKGWYGGSCQNGVCWCWRYGR